MVIAGRSNLIGLFFIPLLSGGELSYRIRGLHTILGLETPRWIRHTSSHLNAFSGRLCTSHSLIFSAMQTFVNRVIHRLDFFVTHLFIAGLFALFVYLYVLYRNNIISKCYGDRLTNFCVLNDNGFLFLYTRCGYIRHRAVTLSQLP